MKLVGVIVEYNPFHNGHIYHLQRTKLLFPNSQVIALMSGDVTQRGSFAIVDKKRRAKMALKYGADAVVQLPRFQTLQAAHLFAEYSVMILAKLGIENLVFGSESNQIKKLTKIAHAQLEKQPLINKHIKKFLKTGLSYPKAYNETLKLVINESVEDSNDMLAIQYLKAILKNNFPITAHAIKRTIPFHSDVATNQYASATLIRKLVSEQKSITAYSPLKIKYFNNQKQQNHKIYRQLITVFNQQPLSLIKDFHLVGEGIENLVKKQLQLHDNYEDLVEACVSRRYTRSRIQRTLMSIYYQLPKRELTSPQSQSQLKIIAINRRNKKLKKYLKTIRINKYE